MFGTKNIILKLVLACQQNKVLKTMDLEFQLSEPRSWLCPVIQSSCCGAFYLKTLFCIHETIEHLLLSVWRGEMKSA